jgi:peptidoglycan/xylan/chitin deacetylase (PgdA/CDA1 family)
MNPVPVLLYHSVDDDPRPEVARWSVTPRQFRDHMHLLRDQGWSTLTMTALVRRLEAGEPLPPRTLAVTFDDGFEDVLTAALPAMPGMVGTAYVTSGYLRDLPDPEVAAPGRMLATTQLSELPEAGWEVGVHGHRHVALDAVRRATARRDITDSKHLVEDALGEATRSFAYPYGYHDRVVKQMVRDAGFDNAAAVKNVHSHTSDDRWALARITIERSTRWQDLADRLLAADPPVAPDRDRLTTVGWRAARRIRAALAATPLAAHGAQPTPEMTKRETPR